jgi:hypothetical protein
MNKDDNEVNVTFKIYPTRYKNNRGFYIGKYTIDLKSENSPVGLLNEVDFYLNSLFKNIINDMKPMDDKTKKEPNEIISVIPVDIESMKLHPSKYKKPLIKGGVKTRINKIKNKNKNKTRRNKVKK